MPMSTPESYPEPGDEAAAAVGMVDAPLSSSFQVLDQVETKLYLTLSISVLNEHKVIKGRERSLATLDIPVHI
jgi:hypothetical protein